MIFRPKIFISSTFKENEKIRQNIQKHLYSYNKCSEWKISDYNECLKKFFDAYKEFKALIQDIKTEVDII